MWVVLVGPKNQICATAASQTTGQILAERLGWAYGIIVDSEEKEDETTAIANDNNNEAIGRVVELDDNDADPTILAAVRNKAAKGEDTTSVYVFRLIMELQDEKCDNATMERQRKQEEGEFQKLLDNNNKNNVVVQIVPTHLQWSPEQVAQQIQCALLDLVMVGVDSDHHDKSVAGLYPDLSSAVRTLRSVTRVLPETVARVLLPLLEKEERYVPQAMVQSSSPSTILPPNDMKIFPSLIIVVEGLDGCGKTTLVKQLAQHLGGSSQQAVSRKSPPTSLDEARAAIECEDDSSYLSTCLAYGHFKRAFYTFGNYVCATELCALGNDPIVVVVDRFVSSTISYTLGARDSATAQKKNKNDNNNNNNDESPSLPVVATWPWDMPIPDLVLVLEATEEVRMARIDQRSGEEGIVGVGEWEIKSMEDVCLGPAILHHMTHIQNGPRTLSVDANAPDPDIVFRRCAWTLIEQGVAVVFRQVVSKAVCELILQELQKAHQKELPQTLLNRYKWEMTNTLYGSRRHSAQVCVLQSDPLKTAADTIAQALTQATASSGHHNMESCCWSVEDDIWPVFWYQQTGGHVKGHRDVQLTSLREYCALLTVSKRGEDFDDGAFWVNAHATVDLEGQPLSELTTKRQIFDDLTQGDVVVFCNRRCIHGVEPVRIPESGRGRVSTSFRM